MSKLHIYANFSQISVIFATETFTGIAKNLNDATIKIK